MTHEEAIKLLKQYQGYEPMFPDGEKLKHAFDLTDETVDTLLAALRFPTREMVERMPRCEHCHDGWSVDGQSIFLGNKKGFLMHFCPACGAPLTHKAVDMMLERWKEAAENA